MFKIHNIIEDKILLETTNKFKFIAFIQDIFYENKDFAYMQKPTSIIGCKRYVDEYCDNLNLEVR